MATDIKVPDLGDFKDVEVIDVLVKPGDQIDVDTPLISIETEKATMDVPSTAAGVITSLALKKGDRVSKGSLIGQIEAKGGAAPAVAAPAGAKKTSGAVEEPVSTPSISKEQSERNAGAPAKAEAPSKPASGGGSAGGGEVRVPDLGDFKDVEVIDVLVKPGDRIEVDTPLLTLETEKATMDVPSTAAGVVKSLALKKGDRVSKGALIGLLEGGAAPAAKAAPEAPKAAPAEPAKAAAPAAAPAKKEPAPAPAPATPAPAATKGLPQIDEAGFARAYASPSVRKFARELGADLSRMKGTGPKGRITPEDVKAFVKQALTSGAPAGAGAAAGGGALPKIPEVDFSKFGEIEVKPLSRIQKISGPHLQASWLNIPHVWQMDEADITELEETRKKLKGEAEKQGIKLTPLAFVLRACVLALKQFPNVNSSLESSGKNLILKKFINLGFAADTPGGLVVPVIKDADKKDIYEIARELADLSAKARDGKLKITEMQGATFTVSSLGGIGGVGFTPIINAPEVAILGVAKSSFKPVYKDGQFVPRLMLPFTLAYDHRVIDGAAGVRFTTFLAEKLADVRGLIEAVP
ncbi:dihydrolipoyllysine-residue acetyltransferase [Steroidobacter agaridevorans]|uniref:dihydrolipoyllysine-residue acetyltransferase n=1 Tax=Steroidobacter agaridevorans TaxID=2695856 RepID=UPI001328E5EE|nr:dihydrolipoyllysine-residue acetyltransferase [Steroidobacter agaridevorans]GFE91007.1 acetyltransferase component of pyruvate dehydrogenase complex [Steroidobacter agaridevorans]